MSIFARYKMHTVKLMNHTMTKEEQSQHPIIEVIAEKFEIPQLEKERRIYALLPHNYYETDKVYPVLYLQDAQNLFDDHAPFGNWAIDRRLAELSRIGKGDIIIIAVDHGGRERISEYSPYYHRKFGKGKGKSYAKFITKTLKPYIDQNYRTLPHRDYNGIGGSSMGALISAYTGIVYPKYFSKLMIFSPSFWYSDEIYFDAFQYNYVMPMRAYIYAGEKESKFMSQHIHRFSEALTHGEFSSKLTKFKISINNDGEHSEYFWGEAFKPAISWLYFNQDEEE
jgi:predicted alpha/beta superfamily hydrolase